MLRTILISLALFAAITLAAVGGGLRGMGDGGLRASAGVTILASDGYEGMGDGGLSLQDEGSDGMGDGGLRGMGDGGL